MTLDTDLTGRVVVVTGASRGIGRGLARHLAGRGARLVVTGRKQHRLDSLAQELDGLGADFLPLSFDVADREACRAMADATVARFGRIDGLVANAQTFRSVTPLAEVGEADMDLLFDTGPKGTLWLMQAVYPHMKAQGRGRIVTFGSNAGLTGGAGYGPYSSSKEAIRGLTRVAAREWGADGITVNCVCPVSAGHRAPPDDDPQRKALWERTYANQPIPRDGDAETDIAPVVAFLLSDASQYMTGQTVMADGGAVMLH
ncbi:MAG: SDR family oxidoreductase [Actinobacteria bacterium]|nr:SDR family oxidoreductase [Actinomycetota bacterium]